MATDPQYFVTSDVDTYFVGKDTGLPLANGTLEFYRDVARNVPKSVFQIIGAPPDYDYVELPNPLTLSSVGTAQDAGGDNVVIYYKPNILDPSSGEPVVDLYYVVGKDENGIVQFTREAWPTINDTGTIPPSSQVSLSENQISNPTFTNILINDVVPVTFNVTTSGEFPVAPDWSIVAQGTGTVVVQRTAIAGSSQLPANPPYILDITVGSGITSCFLRQRFNVNSGLWTGVTGESIYLAGSFVARNANSGEISVTMFYAESSGNSAQQIFTGTVENFYQRLVGISASPIALSANTNTGINAWVDIYLSFPQSSHVQVSSIQLIPTLDSTLDTFPDDFNSSNRNEAFQGDYYIPRLNQKRIPSYLTGWDFVVNPFQFGISTTVTTNPVYVCDQTIVAQTGSISVTAARSVWTQGLSLASNNVGADSFYILQYLSGKIVRDMLGTNLSVNVNAARVTTGSNPPTVRVYLFRAPAATAIPTLPTTIVTLNADGTYSALASGWTEIPRFGLTNYPTAQATLTGLGTADQWNNGTNDFGFSGWQISSSAQIQDSDKFAILVTFFTSQTATILVNSVSLVPGDIPCRPGIQSEDEVLRECQYYYEKTYSPATAVGTVTSVNQLVSWQSVSPLDSSGTSVARNLKASNFEFSFETIKRTVPTMTFYSPTTGTAGAVNALLSDATNILISADATFATFYKTNFASFASIGLKRATYVANNNPAAITTIAALANNGIAGSISYHYVADARLGIV